MYSEQLTLAMSWYILLEYYLDIFQYFPTRRCTIQFFVQLPRNVEELSIQVIPCTAFLKCFPRSTTTVGLVGKNVLSIYFEF